MQIPETLIPALTLVGGFVMFAIGISFAWKFFQAALHGKLTYWSGLEKFGFLFIPITWMASPLLCLLPYDPKNSLINTSQSLWIHLVWGPIFFVCALMFMTSGADLMGLPGSNTLNSILTLNRTDVPPCIVYTPPFTYRFPFVKKATRTVIKALTIKVPENKADENAYEQKGLDTSQYSKFGPSWFYDDDDDKPAPVPQQAQTSSPTATPAASKKSTSSKKH